MTSEEHNPWASPEPSFDPSLGTGLTDIRRMPHLAPASHPYPAQPIEHVPVYLPWRDGGLAEGLPQQEPAPIIPGPDTLTHPPVHGWAGRHQVRWQNTANGTLAIPATSTAAITTILLTPQQGIIRAVTANICNASFASANNLVVQIQNYFGRILFGMTITVGVTAVTFSALSYTNIAVPFDNGLYLALKGAATPTGNVMVNLVWES